MQVFVSGQRWINEAQLSLGLGSVEESDFRTVKVRFQSTGESLVYAKESMPLTRVKFSKGDLIETVDFIRATVQAVHEKNGLLIYWAVDQSGQNIVVPEQNLSHQIQLNRPSEKLFNGLIDKDIWFELRYLTRQLQTQIARNPLRGLTSGRVSLIPHQLYIANQVATRFAPRILLADQVGLGKTIEAGMIIHQQLVTELSERVLIVVPESLLHQWLVEMLRKFNLQFKIFDQSRVDSFSNADVEQKGQDEFNQHQKNLFSSEQLVICSLEFLLSSATVYKQCRDANWDLLVVDESHHLQWEEGNPSLEYQLIEQLAQTIRGVLLLTATPEQLGKSSHFARLRLLDPDRFSSYEQFLEEEFGYAEIADVIQNLQTRRALEPAQIKFLESLLGQDGLNKSSLATSYSDGDREKYSNQSMIEKLLDLYGTGRILFRNTRDTIKGFPERLLQVHAVTLPNCYVGMLDTFKQSMLDDAQLLLCPELLYQVMQEGSVRWTKRDGRVAKLHQVLADLYPEKVLVITASADTALDLVNFLKMQQGVSVAVFHEGMNMVERDRTAAWFSDVETGPQVLICSEIGSEGRNFQFARHLVLFDLPLNPDLLEQRIGRLDRIGQQKTIHIHIIFLKGSAQEVMFHWYHDGLNAFRQTCPSALSVFTEVTSKVLEHLHNPSRNYTQLIADTAQRTRSYNAILQKGRNRLLELNSCRPEVANALKNEAEQQDRASTIQSYMEQVFDCYDVDYEFHSENCYALNIGSHMMAEFPYLPEHGLTVTYTRSTALSHEDIDFLTWDHPLVVNSMDLVLATDQGNTSVIAATLAGVKRGTLLLEVVFVLEPSSSARLQSSRFLPATSIRVMIDQSGKRLDHMPSYRVGDKNSQERIDKETAKRIVKSKESVLRKMSLACEKFAGTLAPEIRNKALQESTITLQCEIDRLENLARVNSSVRQEEIQFYKNQLNDVGQVLEHADLRMDAMRVLLAI